MTPDPPRYVAPPPDPALATLTAQNEQQQNLAISDRVSSASARLMQQYGTRLATSGNSNWSPLIAPAYKGGSPSSSLVINSAAGAL